MRSLIILSFCLSFFFRIESVSVPAFGDSILDSILSQGVLTVGTTGDYIPFSFLNDVYRYQDGYDNFHDVRGIDIELAKSLAYSLGVNIQFVKTTWSSLIEDLHAGMFDIAMSGITKTLLRQKTAFFSSPYLSFGKMAVVRCSDKDKYQSLKDINQGYVTSISNPGGTNADFQREKLDKTIKKIWDDSRTIYSQVANGHADVLVSDSVEVYLHVAMDDRLCKPNINGYFTDQEMGFLMNRDIVWKEYVDLWLHQEVRAGNVTSARMIEHGKFLLQQSKFKSK
eukprot:Awhi_evm1s6467